MRKQVLQLLMASLCLCFSSYSRQTNNTVKGLVTDNNGKPYKAATVMLEKSKDSSLIKTEITDASGKYEFVNIKAGTYFILVTSIGFNRYRSKVFKLEDGQAMDVPTANLLPASNELKGVVVSSKKPLVEVTADKTILNIEGSINATGSNAMELLQKSPGIVVDKDDNISMKGKTGVKIYIDGRPTQMAPTDLAAYLRSMNSADIESIEMISNPSAKFEASGNAGIVNIKLKKNKNFGLNGSIATGLAMGKTLKNNNSLNLNYRNKNANWFGNYSNSFGTNERYFNLYRKQVDSLYDQHSIQPNIAKNHNFKVGVDLSLDKKNTLGFMVTGNLSTGDLNSTSNTPISSLSTGIVARTLIATNAILSNRKNFNFNSNYRFADTSGHELNVDANFGAFRSTGTSYQPNTYFYPNGTIQSQFIYKNNTPTDINIYTLKIDYEQNFKGGKLGLGGKYSYVTTDNTFDFWNVDPVSNIAIKDLNQSNAFKYTENVNALYVNYNRPLGKKYNLQAGLRMEQTISEGLLTSALVQNDDDVKRNYVDFFPSAALTYTANQKNQFTATFSKRIDRPPYQNLNPFETKLDELTYQKGNAFLKPQYTNSFEINHLYNYKISTTIGYSHVKDLFAPITDSTDRNKTFITTKNLATQNIVSLTIGSPFSIAKIWNGYLNVSTNYSHYKTDSTSIKAINIEVINYNLSAQNTFSVSKGVTAELTAYFVGPSLWGGTFKSKSMGGFDIGIQKLILQDKGTLKLALTDVAHTMSFRGISNYSGTYLDVSGSWESQQLRLNFSYRFGKTTVKAAIQHKSGVEDENKRLNGTSSSP